MLDLKVTGKSAEMAGVAAARLDAIPGATTVRPGHSVVFADVAHDSVEDVLDELERLAVPQADMSLARVELVGQLAGRKPDTGLVWADAVGPGPTHGLSAAISRSWSSRGDRVLRHRRSQPNADRQRDGGQPRPPADRRDRGRRDRPRRAARAARAGDADRRLAAAGISVTTIPAAAYFGIAPGLGQAREATGALAVLSLNVLCLMIGAAGTLFMQRRRGARRRSDLAGGVGRTASSSTAA